MRVKSANQSKMTLQLRLKSKDGVNVLYPAGSTAASLCSQESPLGLGHYARIWIWFHNFPAFLSRCSFLFPSTSLPNFTWFCFTSCVKTVPSVYTVFSFLCWLLFFLFYSFRSLLVSCQMFLPVVLFLWNFLCWLSFGVCPGHSCPGSTFVIFCLLPSSVTCVVALKSDLDRCCTWCLL